MTTQQLSGTTAIVTGASRGLGRGVAAALAKAGARVVGVARDAAALDEVREQLGGTFTAVTADAADPVVAGQLIDTYQPRTLVLNAGAAPLARPVHRHTWQTFSRNWEVDVQHAFHWTREALLRPLDPGSTVIAVSSGAALRGSPISGGYAGAKATIRFLTGYAAEESRREGLGIRFISVLPDLTPGHPAGPGRGRRVRGAGRRGCRDLPGEPRARPHSRPGRRGNRQAHHRPWPRRGCLPARRGGPEPSALTATTAKHKKRRTRTEKTDMYDTPIANRRSRTAWTLVLAVGAFMAALDVVVVSTALPTLQHRLGASLADLEWTINAYSLVFGALMLTGAALGERFGRRRMYVLGLATFVAGSAAAATASGAGMLIAARVVQGAGAAMLVPLTLTLISSAFPVDKRGAAIGIWGGITGLGVAAGRSSVARSSRDCPGSGSSGSTSRSGSPSPGCPGCGWPKAAAPGRNWIWPAWPWPGPGCSR